MLHESACASFVEQKSPASRFPSSFHASPTQRCLLVAPPTDPQAPFSPRRLIVLVVLLVAGVEYFHQVSLLSGSGGAVPPPEEEHALVHAPQYQLQKRSGERW
jgi:hypothetical protein